MGTAEAADTRLDGRVAVVTGAGSGIGRAIALALAGAGAAVVAVGRRRARLEETARAAAARGGRAETAPCDVTDAVAVAGLFDGVRARHGRLDVLVNDAAHNRPDRPLSERVAELDERWWDATLAVNLTGTFLCTKYALPLLCERERASIVNVASTSGLAGNTNQGAYVASKHGVVGLTRAVALDYAAQGVRANVICPGFIETERSLAFSRHNRGPDWRAAKLASIPLGRLGRPEDVAALALFLASDASAYVTGTAIPVDGGTAARRG